MTTKVDYSDLRGKYKHSFEYQAQKRLERGDSHAAVAGAAVRYIQGAPPLNDIMAAVNRVNMDLVASEESND